MSLTMGFIPALLNTYRSSISGGEEEEVAFFDGVTYTAGELVAGSGARTVDVELTYGGNAITSGTGGFVMFALSDTNFNASTGVYTSDVRITSVTGAAWAVIPDATGDNNYADFLLIPASEGHVKCTVTYTCPGGDPISAYLCVILPSGGIDISAEIVIPATA